MSPLDSAGIRARRERLGVSQRELARRAGLRQATVSRIETGTLVRITLDHIEALAAALDCDPGELLNVRRRRKRSSDAAP